MNLQTGRQVIAVLLLSLTLGNEPRPFTQKRNAAVAANNVNDTRATHLVPQPCQGKINDLEVNHVN